MAKTAPVFNIFDSFLKTKFLLGIVGESGGGGVRGDLHAGITGQYLTVLVQENKGRDGLDLVLGVEALHDLLALVEVQSHPGLMLEVLLELILLLIPGEEDHLEVLGILVVFVVLGQDGGEAAAGGAPAGGEVEENVLSGESVDGDVTTLGLQGGGSEELGEEGHSSIEKKLSEKIEGDKYIFYHVL